MFAGGSDAGDRASAVFRNAITPVAPPTVAELAARATRRLLFYARPEPHAARNMFELGALALSRAFERGAFDHGWTLHGIGTVDAARGVWTSAAARRSSCCRARPRTTTPRCCARTTLAWR